MVFNIGSSMKKWHTYLHNCMLFVLVNFGSHYYLFYFSVSEFLGYEACSPHSQQAHDYPYLFYSCSTIYTGL